MSKPSRRPANSEVHFTPAERRAPAPPASQAGGPATSLPNAIARPGEQPRPAARAAPASCGSWRRSRAPARRQPSSARGGQCRRACRARTAARPRASAGTAGSGRGWYRRAPARGQTGMRTTHSQGKKAHTLALHSVAGDQTSASKFASSRGRHRRSQRRQLVFLGRVCTRAGAGGAGGARLPVEVEAELLAGLEHLLLLLLCAQVLRLDHRDLLLPLALLRGARCRWAG